MTFISEATARIKELIPQAPNNNTTFGTNPPSPSSNNSNLPDVDITPSASTYNPTTGRVLSKNEARVFFIRILGKKGARLSDQQIASLIINTNIVVNRNRSAHLTPLTVQKVLINPAVRDKMRLVYQGTLTNINIDPVPPAMPADSPTPLDNITALAVADKALDPAILNAFRKGVFKLKVRFTSEKGQITGFRVLLQFFWFQEVIAEYRGGKVTKNPEGHIARGAVIYLQRLLWGAGYLDTRGYFAYGVFCKDTLNALYTFLANKNLISAFNVKVSSHMFKEIANEADLAYAQYQAITGNGLVKRALRYEQAKQALGKILRALQVASRYKDIPLDKLSNDERKFIQGCIQRSKTLRTRAQELLKQILKPGDKKERLFQLDINIVLNSLKEYKKNKRLYRYYRKRYEGNAGGYTLDGNSYKGKYKYHRKKYIEAFNNTVSTIAGTLGTLRQWQVLAQFDPALYKEVKKYIKIALDKSLRVYIKDFPELNRYVDKQFQLIDQEIISIIEGSSELGKKDPKARHERAMALLDAVVSNGQSFGNHPARGVILSLINSYLKKGKSLSSLKFHLWLLRRLHSAQPHYLQRLAIHYIHNSKRVAIKGEKASRQAGSDLSQDIQDTMITDVRRFADYGGSTQNKVFNLAFILYSFLQTHNTHAKAAGKPELDLGDLIATVGDVVENIQGQITEARLKGMSVRARRIMAALKKAGYIHKNGREYFIKIKVKLDRDDFDLGLNLPPEEKDKIFNILKEARALQISGKGSRQETIKTLNLLINTSDDPVVAKYELSQQLEAILTKRKMLVKVNNQHFRRLMGGSELVLTPLAIRKLESSFTKTSAIRGKVSYESIKRWGPQYLPKGAKAGDWFFVSQLGIFKIPKGYKGLDKIPTIPFNNLAGKRIEREPNDFIKTESLAVLKLSIARLVQVSDAEVLILASIMRGGITARLKAIDLRGLIKVFGAGKYWIVQPGTLSLLPMENDALNTVANFVEATNTILWGEHAKIPGLLRRTASGRSDIRFTKEEKEALASFLSQFDINSYSHLEPLEQRSIKSAIAKLKHAFSKLYHKGGLDAKQQKALSDLAAYLSWDESLSLNDYRLTGKSEYLNSLTRKLSVLAKAQGKTFDAKTFKAVYRKAFTVLRRLHGDLQVLASKYPPEEPGWEGKISFAYKHYKGVIKAMKESVVAPSQESSFMTGLSNDMVVRINYLLMRKTLIPRLKSINAELTKLEDRIKKDIIKAKNNSPLVRAVNVCKGLYSAFQPTLAALRKENNKLDDDNPLKQYILVFLSIAERLEQLNKNPSAYITGADQMLQTVQLHLAKVKRAFQSEINTKDKDLLRTLMSDLEKASRALKLLIKVRDKVLPVFIQKAKLEAERYEIMFQLSSDRFDVKKLKMLKKIFGGKLYKTSISSNILHAVARIFTGQSKYVTGSGFKTTKLTVGEILDKTIAYLEKHPDKSISLSSLLVQPGEDRQIFLAKCALSTFFNGLAREQNLSLPKALSAVLFGDGSSNLWIALPAILSRAAGGVGEITIGPENYAEMVATANSPLRHLYYSGLSFLAMASSGEKPKMNLSSQLYMILNSSPNGQKTLAGVLASGGRNSFKLDKVNYDTLKVFLEYLRDEILPKLKNSRRLRQRLAYLLARHKAHINLNDYRKNPQKIVDDFLKGIPKKENFKIYDSFHAQERVKLSQLVETTLAIVGEINQSRALQDPENYALTYFDPIQALRDAQLKYNLPGGLNIKPPKNIYVIHYSADPEAGPITNVSSLETLLLIDTPDWMNLYAKKALFGLINNVMDDPLTFLEEAAVESIGFAAHFLKLMGPQIRMGFTDTFGGLGDLLRAGTIHLVGNKKRAKQIALAALERISKGLQHTTGGFFVFETLPLIFYSDVKAAIEAGDYTKAFAKALAITAMFSKTLRVTYDVLHYLWKKGEVKLIKGKGIFIKDPARAEALSNKLAAKEHALEFLKQRSVLNRLGIKLLNYHFNPFTYVDLWKSIRTYGSGGLTVQIQRSPVQFSLVDKAKETPTRWTRIADFANRYTPGRMYRPNLTWRKLARLWDVAGDTRGLLSSKKAGVALDSKTAYIARNVLADGNATLTHGQQQIKGSQLPAHIQTILQKIQQGKMDPKILDSKIKLSTGESISINSILTYQNAEANLRLIWENPNHYYDLTYTKPYAKGKAIGQICVDGFTYAKLIKARAAGDKGTFRRIIKSHNLLAGAEYTGSSIQQLWAACEAPANVYTEIEGNLPRTEGKSFNAFKLLQKLTVGKGLGNTYKLDIFDPRTGKAVVDPKTGKKYKITGRQILEILHNVYIKQSSKPVINEQVDALVREHFGKTVNGLDLHKMVKRAARRYEKGRSIRYKYAGNLYVRSRMTGRLPRRLLRRVFGTYKFGRPRYTSWKSIYKKLEGSTLVTNYAKYLSNQFGSKVRMSTARRILAKKIYNQYINQRVASVMETLDNAAKEVLSPRQYAHYKKKGGLKRGLIFRRYFQKVYHSRQFKEQLSDNLNVIEKGHRNLAKIADEVLRQEGIANPIFEYKTMAESLNARLGGSLRVVEIRNTHTFSIQDARGQRYARVRFKNVDGKTSIDIRQLKHWKKLGIRKGTPEYENYVKLQEIAYLEKVKNLGRKLGISEPKLAEFSSIKDLKQSISKIDSELADKIFSNSGKVLKQMEKLIKDYKTGKITDPELKKKVGKFARWMKKQSNLSRRKMMTMTARSLIVGFLTIVGVEQVADWLDIKNPLARLAFVLGPTHVISHSAERLLTLNGAKSAWASLANFSRTMIRPPVELGRVPRLKYITGSLGKLNWIGGIGSMIKGIGQGVVIARAYNGLLDILKVGKNSIWRHSLVQMGSIFSIQTGISLGYELAINRIAARALISGAATTAKEAGEIAAGSRLGMLGRFLGPVATGIGLCNLVDALVWPATNDFKGLVRRETYKAAMKALKQRSAWGTWTLGKIGHFLASGATEDQTMGTVIMDKVVDKYMKQSNEIRSGLRATFQSMLTLKVYSRYRGQATSAEFFSNANINENGEHITNDRNYRKYVESLVIGSGPALNQKLTEDIRKAFKYLHFVNPATVVMVKPGDPSNNDDIRAMFTSKGTLKSTRIERDATGHGICLKNPRPTDRARSAFFRWIAPDQKSILAGRKQMRIAYLMGVQSEISKMIDKVLATKGRLPTDLQPADKQLYNRVLAELTRMGIKFDQEKKINLTTAQAKQVVSKLMLASGEITQVDQKMMFVSADGLVNTKHPAYLEIQKAAVRRAFVRLSKPRLATAIAEMLKGIYESPPAEPGTTSYNKQKRLKQTLSWLGYKLTGTMDQRLQTLGRKIREIETQLKGDPKNVEELSMQLARLKESLGRIIKKMADKETDVLHKARKDESASQQTSIMIQKERAREQLKPLNNVQEMDLEKAAFSNIG